MYVTIYENFKHTRARRRTFYCYSKKDEAIRAKKQIKEQFHMNTKVLQKNKKQCRMHRPKNIIRKKESIGIRKCCHNKLVK